MILLAGIEGYLADEFIMRNNRNEFEYFSALTNKQYKLDLLLVKKPDEVIIFQVGVYLKITGDLYKAKYVYIWLI